MNVEDGSTALSIASSSGKQRRFERQNRFKRFMTLK
jgi:hypothetical protein